MAATSTSSPTAHLAITQAASYLAVSVTTVRAFISRGQVAARREEVTPGPFH